MSLADTDALYPSAPAVLAKTDRQFTVKSFGLTDTGRVRPANEDQFVIVEWARTMSVHQTSVPQAKAQYSGVSDGDGGSLPS